MAVSTRCCGGLAVQPRSHRACTHDLYRRLAQTVTPAGRPMVAPRSSTALPCARLPSRGPAPRHCSNLAAAAVQARIPPPGVARNRTARARTIVVIGAVIEHDDDQPDVQGKTRTRALKWTMEARLTIHAASVEARAGACIRT